MSDLFTKQVSSCFTPDEIRLIFENNKRYFNAAQSIDGLRMPQPISHTDTELTFERLPGMGETLGQAWFHEKKWDAGLCRQIGWLLGRLHKAQGNLQDKIFIHGDFVPHNIVIQDREVVFFDCEPPAVHRDFMHFYENYNYVDLASFIFFIFISHSYKRPWRFLRNKRPFAEHFLSGYETGASFVCDRPTLRKYLKQERKKWYRDYQFCFVRKMIEYGIVRMTLFVQMSVYRVLDD